MQVKVLQHHIHTTFKKRGGKRKKIITFLEMCTGLFLLGMKVQ
jgi:hypothetical protein